MVAKTQKEKEIVVVCIKKTLRQWRKENLIQMKKILWGMRYVGYDEDGMYEYKMRAADCVRWKKLIKSL